MSGQAASPLVGKRGSVKGVKGVKGVNGRMGEREKGRKEERTRVLNSFA
jgi:hypothetical protein